MDVPPDDVADDLGPHESGRLPIVSVLLVDDRPENLLALEASLEPLGQRLVLADSGDAALRAVLAEQFAVILMDIRMPGIDGFETMALLKQRENSRDTPPAPSTTSSSRSSPKRCARRSRCSSRCARTSSRSSTRARASRTAYKRARPSSRR